MRRRKRAIAAANGFLSTPWTEDRAREICSQRSASGAFFSHCSRRRWKAPRRKWPEPQVGGGAAAHGCRVSPRTGLRVPPSASMLDRLGKLLDADELEAALTGAVAALALDPAIPAAYAAHRAEQRREQQERQKKRKPPAAEAFREDRQDGWFRPHPLHPWLDPAVTGDPGTFPPAGRSPSTARNARAPRPEGTRRCTSSPPSPTCRAS